MQLAYTGETRRAGAPEKGIVRPAAGAAEAPGFRALSRREVA